jgi:hypothetical protein
VKGRKVAVIFDVFLQESPLSQPRNVVLGESVVLRGGSVL